MAFLTLEDETGLIEAAMLPGVYPHYGERVTTPGPFLVGGRLLEQQGAVYVEITSMVPFYKRESPFDKPTIFRNS